MVCPIIKTREALYIGGIVERPEQSVNGVVYSDAPVIMALGAYDTTRRDMKKIVNGGTGSSRSDVNLDKELDTGDIYKLRVLRDFTNELNNKSIDNLLCTGSAETYTQKEVVDKYATGDNLMDQETSLVNAFKNIYNE